MNSRLIRLPEVLEQVGFSKRTLHRKVQNKEFPQPIVVARDTLGRSTMNLWRLQEVLLWIANPMDWITKFGGQI